MTDIATGELGSVTNPIPMNLIWYKADAEGNKTFYTAAGSGSVTSATGEQIQADIATIQNSISSIQNQIASINNVTLTDSPTTSDTASTNVGASGYAVASMFNELNTTLESVKAVVDTITGGENVTDSLTTIISTVNSLQETVNNLSTAIGDTSSSGSSTTIQESIATINQSITTLQAAIENVTIDDATTEASGKVRLATEAEIATDGGTSVVTATQLKDKIQVVESSSDATQVGVLYFVTGS